MKYPVCLFSFPNFSFTTALLPFYSRRACLSSVHPSFHPSIHLSRILLLCISSRCKRYWTRFVCSTHGKPNAETWRLAADKGFIHEAAEWEDRRTSLRFASQRWGAQDIYRIEKQSGLRCGERRLEVGKRWGNQCSVQAYLSYMLLRGMHDQKMAVLARSEGGVFGPLTSKGHLWDTHAGPVGGSVVPNSLNLNLAWTWT